MGLLDKLIPNEVKKVFKPVAKFSKKFIPKEIRPFLPFATPFLPAMGIMGQLGGPMGFAKMYGANLLSQQLADPDAEFDELNQIAALLSGTQGGLMGTETAQNLRDKTTYGKAIKGSNMMGPVDPSTLPDRSLLTKASDLGKNISAVGSDYLTDNMNTLRDIGAGRMPLNLATAKEGLKAAAIPFSEGMGGVSEALTRPAIREWEAADAAEQAQMEETTTANEQEAADLTMRYYREAGHSEDTVQAALETNDLSEYYVPPESAANGGIIGLRNGGRIGFSIGGGADFGGIEAAVAEEPTENNLKQITMGLSRFLGLPGLAMHGGMAIMNLWNDLNDEDKSNVLEMGKTALKYSSPASLAVHKGIDAAKSLAGFKDGGMLNFDGREMDLRTGGFVPIGKKEKADDVPARLSKNEFVMTADAVRAAGGGSVNKGAQRMYDVMNKLEARA